MSGRTMKDISYWPGGHWIFGGYDYPSKKKAIEAVRKHNHIMRMLGVVK